MDFQSAMEIFSEAWIAANTGKIAPPGHSQSPNQSQPVISPGSTAETIEFMSKGGSTSSTTLAPPPLPPQNVTNLVMSSEEQHQFTPKVLPSSVSGIMGMDLSSNSSNIPSNPHKRFKTTSQNPSSRKEISPDSAQLGSKSVPLHCIIEVYGEDNHLQSQRNSFGGSISSSRNGNEMGKADTTNNTNSNVKDSEDCKAEITDRIHHHQNINKDLNQIGNEKITKNGKTIEVDDFVIVPSCTPFHNIVETVLTLLGYPKETIHQAEGTISLRNWKSLSLSQVCDSPNKSVGDILNDLTNHCTLRILVTRAKGGTADDLKEKLLRLLLAQSSSLLMGAGCPLDEVTLSQLIKGHWPQNLAEDVKHRFNQWYSSHAQSAMGLIESLHHHHNQTQQQLQLREREISRSQNQLIRDHHHQQQQLIEHPIISPHHLNNLVNGHNQPPPNIPNPHNMHSNKSPLFSEDEQNHPAFHNLATQNQKTRMRTSFDPELELPKLQHWFSENPHPSRHQIQQYVRELNMLESRKDRKPLDINNVIYWFKNARAAQKRNEMRYNGLSPHPPFSCHPHPHHIHPYPNHHQISLSRERSRERELIQRRVIRDDDDESGPRLSPLPYHHSMHVDDEEIHHQIQREMHRSSVHHQHQRRSRRGSSIDNDLDDANSLSSSREEESITTADKDNDGEEEGNHSHDVDSSELPFKLLKKLKSNDQDDEITVKEEEIETTTDEDFINVDIDMNENNQKSKNIQQSTNGENEPKDLSGQNINNNNSAEENESLKNDTKHEIKCEGDGGEDSMALDHHENDHNNRNNDNNHMESNANSLSSGSPPSCSPRSSPGIISPSAGGPPGHFPNISPPIGPPSSTMVNRFHNFFYHPSFMAYRHQFNSFNFAGAAGTGGNFSPGTHQGVQSGSLSPSSAYSAIESALVGRKSALGLGFPGHKISPGQEQLFQEAFAAQVRSMGDIGGGGSASRLTRDNHHDHIPPFGNNRPNSDLISSLISSRDFGGHHQHHHVVGGGSSMLQNSSSSSMGLDERRKRNRTFIDPVTEVPRLEHWFGMNTHPSHNLILKYTEELNRMQYRQKFPKLESKNIQFWFKNRRAKNKRLRQTLD